MLVKYNSMSKTTKVPQSVLDKVNRKGKKAGYKVTGEDKKEVEKWLDTIGADEGEYAGFYKDVQYAAWGEMYVDRAQSNMRRYGLDPDSLDHRIQTMIVEHETNRGHGGNRSMLELLAKKYAPGPVVGDRQQIDQSKLTLLHVAQARQEDYATLGNAKNYLDGWNNRVANAYLALKKGGSQTAQPQTAQQNAPKQEQQSQDTNVAAPQTAATVGTRSQDPATAPAPAQQSSENTQVANSSLAQLLQANPGITTNQGLINYFYRVGGNTYTGAAQAAKSYGLNLGELTRNRRGSVSPNASASASVSSSPAAAPATQSSTAETSTTVAETAPTTREEPASPQGQAQTQEALPEGNITTNFKWSEFASRGTPVPANLRENVKRLCKNLEVLRESLGGKAIGINSGYRSESHNKSVGGATNSQHMYGTASDIRVTDYTPTQVYDKILELIKDKKMEDGGLGKYNTFTHYDVRGSRARW